ARGSRAYGSCCLEHRHLRGRTKLGILRADRQEAHRVGVVGGDAAGPGLELGACPLEAMVAMPELTRRQPLERRVVLPVRRRHDECLRPRMREDDALEAT